MQPHRGSQTSQILFSGDLRPRVPVPFQAYSCLHLSLFYHNWLEKLCRTLDLPTDLPLRGKQRKKNFLGLTPESGVLRVTPVFSAAPNPCPLLWTTPSPLLCDHSWVGPLPQQDGLWLQAIRALHPLGCQ